MGRRARGSHRTVSRRQVGAGAATLVTSGLLALLLLPGAIGPAGPIVAAEPRAPPTSPSHLQAPALLGQAATSLALGKGPASGTSWRCAGGGTEACSPVAPEGVGPAPTPNGTAAWLASPPSPVTPPDTAGGALAYDSTDGYVVLFGGSVSGAASNQTWTFANGSWTNRTGAGPAPSARSLAAMSDDPTLHGVLLFGGIESGPGGAATLLADTWCYAAGAWSRVEVNATSHPSPRFGAAFAFDTADGYALLFGGATSASGVPSSDASDTWRFVNDSWGRLSTGVSPSARSQAALAYDAHDGDTVLYGGWGTTGLTDTWTYLRGNWTRVATAPASTPRAFGPDLVSAPEPAGVLLIGLAGSTPSSLVAWSFSDGRWEPSSATGLPTIDAGGTGPLLAEGPGGVPLLFDPGGTAACASTTYSATSGGWSDALPTFGDAPCVGEGAAVAEDPADGSVALFGGVLGTTGGLSNATWSLVNGRWSPVATTGDAAPSARCGAAMAYDPESATVILFGGATTGACGTVGPTPTLRQDTWSLRNGTWSELTNLSGPAPPAREGASLVWDAGDGYLLLVGGLGAAGALDDTWTFSRGAWENRTASVTGAPGARAFAAATYDPERGAVVVVGGSLAGPTGSAVDVPSTMSYANGTWSLVDGGVAPPARDGAGLAASSSLGGDVLLGGRNASTGDLLGDVWLLTLSGWSELSLPSTPYGPLPTVGSALVVAEGGALEAVAGSQRLTTGVAAWTLGSALALGPVGASSTPAEVGTAVTVSAAVAGGSSYATFAFSALPPGCGTPTGASVVCVPQTAGLYPLSLGAYDPATRSAASASGALDVVPALFAAGLSASPGVVDLGMSVALTLAARGGVDPMSVSFSGLPPGCAASSSALYLTCVPTAAGSYRITGTVADALGHSESVSAPLRVNADPQVSAVASATLLDVGQPFGVSVYPALGTPPYAVSFSGAPAGCTTSGAYGLACPSGSPGVFTVRVSVADDLGATATALVPVTVDPLPEVVAFVGPAGSVAPGEPLQLSVITVGGTPPLDFVYDGPGGACLLVDGPVISCAPGSPGVYVVSVTITDALGATTSAETSFSVNASAVPGPRPPVSTSPNATTFPSASAPRSGPTLAVLGVAIVAVVALLLGPRRRSGPARRPKTRRGTERGPGR